MIFVELSKIWRKLNSGSTVTSFFSISKNVVAFGSSLHPPVDVVVALGSSLSRSTTRRSPTASSTRTSFSSYSIASLTKIDLLGYKVNLKDREKVSSGSSICGVLNWDHLFNFQPVYRIVIYYLDSPFLWHRLMTSQISEKNAWKIDESSLFNVMKKTVAPVSHCFSVHLLATDRLSRHFQYQRRTHSLYEFTKIVLQIVLDIRRYWFQPKLSVYQKWRILRTYEECRIWGKMLSVTKSSIFAYVAKSL